MSLFERFLTVWVGLCIIAGIVLGHFFPAVFHAVGGAEIANAIATGMLSEIHFDFILAGDIVKNKKPDPEIYNLALQKSGLQPQQAFVVEDSRHGLLAAGKIAD